MKSTDIGNIPDIPSMHFVVFIHHTTLYYSLFLPNLNLILEVVLAKQYAIPFLAVVLLGVNTAVSSAIRAYSGRAHLNLAVLGPLPAMFLASLTSVVEKLQGP